MNFYIEVKNPEVIERRFIGGIKNLLTRKGNTNF